MSLEVEIDDWAPVLEREWEDLAVALSASPFLYPGWIKAWRSSWGRGRPVLLTARRGGELVGILPLERRSGGLHSPTNWHTPEFGALTTDDEVAKEIARALFTQRVRACSLGFVDETVAITDEWAGAARFAGWRPLARVVQSSPFIDTGTGWGAYETSLAKKLRTELRRRRRRLEEEGELSVRLFTGDDDLAGLLEEGFRIEGAAWKGSKGTAINSDDAAKGFYTSISRWAWERGWLQLAFLRLGDENLTFDLCLETGNVHYLIKTGYEPDRRKYAPGMLMRYEMIKRSFELGHTSYEFLGSNNPWKLEWTSDVHNRMLLQAFSPSLGGRAEWAAYAHLRPRAKKLAAAAKRRR